jgi:hypothetical protein
MGRSTAVRRAATVCCSALLALGTSAAIAAAKPAPAPADNLPPALVAAIARDLKLTPAQYLQRAHDAQRLAAFQTTARAKYSSVFGGVWLDGSGRPIVAIAGGTAAPAARQAASAAGFAVKDVVNSEHTLHGRATAIGKWFAAQPRPVAQALRGVAIDTVNNTVAVRVDKSAGNIALPSPFGPVRVITTLMPGSAEVLHAQPVFGPGPGPALLGGQPYAAVAADHALRCSLGFNGIDAAGHVVNITAGHCNPNIPATGTANASGIFALHGDAIGEPLGYFAKSVLGEHDYSIVRIDPADAPRFSNNLVEVLGAPPLPITGVAAPVVGEPVCKAGSRTGFSCGTVNAVHQSVQVGDRQMNDSFSMNICALPGDSGGPVVTGTQAVGISSASSVADYPICEIPDLIGMVTGDVPQLFAEPVTDVLAENPGLRIRTR